VSLRERQVISNNNATAVGSIDGGSPRERLRLTFGADAERYDRVRPSYPARLSYSTAEYRDLLLTYSGHIALELVAREGMLDCIGELIESRYGGRITKR